MKTVHHGFSRRWLAVLAGLLFSGATFAQTGNVPPAASGSSSTLQTYLQERQALFSQWQALVAQGATEEQLEVWRQ